MTITNFYVVWYLMEMAFIYFLLIILKRGKKNTGLVVYFFLQSGLSLFLFIFFFIGIYKLVIVCLFAKIGFFPFTYWVVVVTRKMSYLGNMFILGWQKFPLFWIIWLVGISNFPIYLLFLYLTMLFSSIRLWAVTDLWLLLVHSSIINTALLVFLSLRAYYSLAVRVYMVMVISIVYLISKITNQSHFLGVIFIFLVIPPFLLFVIKFYIMLGMDFSLKLIFLIFIFDAMILIYYFTLIFTKFLLSDNTIIIYFINIIILLCVLLLRNCVALVIFH